MGTITDRGQASTLAGSICAALDSVRDAEFTRFSDTELLQFAPILERVARLTFAAQVQLAGEIDTRRIAAAHGCHLHRRVAPADPADLRRTTPPPG